MTRNEAHTCSQVTEVTDTTVGLVVGDPAAAVGEIDGVLVGFGVGTLEGLSVGDSVGDAVGS
jgi:hypothetical protein